jgi:hypothetical protein
MEPRALLMQGKLLSSSQSLILVDLKIPAGLSVGLKSFKPVQAPGPLCPRRPRLLGEAHEPE